MNKVLFVAALTIGAGIAYVDARPNWDDAGVTAAAIVLATGILGGAGPSRPWLWALAVGLWIPARGLVLHRNYAALLVLLFAFAGAYAGMALRRVLLPQKNPNPA